LLIAVLLSFAVDIQVAAYVRFGTHPHWFAELLECSEFFGHGIGCTMILIAVVVLHPARRPCIPQLLAGSLGAGMINNGIKLVINRSRPYSLDVLPDSVWSTFGGMWSFSVGNSAQSFPSGHTATAVGLAVMLSAYYPLGRWYFTILAILVGLQRIHVAAHYPSDVFAGAIVGWCTATLCLALGSKWQLGKLAPRGEDSN
jgi:membrane-associated phospholipid phosphatase